jgi:YHS domain-containing protein
MANICYMLITKTKCFHIISLKGKSFYCTRKHTHMFRKVHTTSTANTLEENQSLIFSIFCFWTLVKQSNATHLKQYTSFQQSTKQMKQ